MIPDSLTTLQKKHTMDVLFAVGRLQPAKLSDIVVNSHPRHNRLKELIDAGLVSIDDAPRQHNTKFVSLTWTGTQVVSHLLKIAAVMEGEE